MLHPSEALRDRMRLVQAVLFAGSNLAFAKAIGVSPHHLTHALYLNSRITVNMAAQVVSRTSVNARWLLTGEGPMLADTGAETPERLELPPAIRSQYPVFDSLTGVVPPKRVKRSAALPEAQPTPEALMAAQAIYVARLANKPVTLFCGREFCEAGGLVAVERFLAAGYVTGLALTGCALPYVLPRNRRDTYAFDRIVKLAAVNGVGLGEALGRWATPRAPTLQGALGLAEQKSAVITAHVEPGEIPELFQPRTRGAEFGAQLGAATYVDSLVFIEQVLRGAGTPPGVFIVCSEYARLARLVGSAVLSLRTTTAADDLKTFSFVTVNQPPCADADAALKNLGGTICNLKNNAGSLQAAAELLAACDKTYAGLS